MSSLSSLIKSEKVSVHAVVSPEHAPGTMMGSNDRAHGHLERAARRARAMLSEARQRSQAMIEQALAGATILEEVARKKGFEAGFQSGVESGLAQAQALCDEVRARSEDFDRRYRSALQEAEGALIHASLGLAECMVGRAIQLEPRLVADMASKVIASLTDETRLRLRLREEFVDVVELHKQELLAALPGLTSVEVVVDNSLSPGVVVEGKWGYVDGTLHAQVKEADRLMGERGLCGSAEPEGGPEP